MINIKEIADKSDFMVNGYVFTLEDKKVNVQLLSCHHLKTRPWKHGFFHGFSFPTTGIGTMMLLSNKERFKP